MEKQSWLNWRTKMEGVVNDLKETVKVQAAKLELLEKTLKEHRDRLEKLKAEQQFPSRNSELENHVGRLVRLCGLPADTQVCRSEDAGTAVSANEAREEREIECICIDEETELIPESFAPAEKRKVSEAESSETFDLGEEIADKKRKNSRGAEPGRISVSGRSAKPPRDDHHRSVKNKKCATIQLKSTVTRQPERRISTMPKLGAGKKNSCGVERRKCTLCLKTLATAQSLRQHIGTHTGEKPFKCQTCQRAFAISSTLRKHMRIHTGEKPFKCEVCQKAFTASTDLRKHKRIHTGEKPFKCQTCQRAFAISSTLRKHMRTHTDEKPFKCEVCQKAFTASTDLRKHKRIHTGEKPFRCNFCNATFAWSSILRDHIRIHTGEKPFKCAVCGAGFKRWGDLYVHKKIHA